MPSVTASDRGSAGGDAGAQLLQGALAPAITQLRAVVAEAEADHDMISQVTGLMVLQNALAYHGDVAEARAVAETAISPPQTSAVSTWVVATSR